MRNLDQLKQVTDRIKYRDWRVNLSDTNGTPWMQVQFIATDLKTGQTVKLKSGKQLLSYHMCDNELIRTAYQTIQRAIMHELDEEFTYDGVAVFNPHFDYTDIACAVREGVLKINVREENP